MLNIVVVPKLARSNAVARTMSNTTSAPENMEVDESARPPTTSSVVEELFKSIPFRLKDCKTFYVDVGSNIGVQVRKLFEPELYHPNPVENLFYEKYGPVQERRHGVCAIGVEPNPTNHIRLGKIQQAYNRQGWRTFFLQAGVWDNEEGLSFQCKGGQVEASRTRDISGVIDFWS